MKKYTIKNYKGNIVESLMKFQKKYPNAKICEATEEDGSLKVTADEKQSVKEAIGKTVYAVMLHDDDKYKTILGVFSSKNKAQEFIDNAKGWEHAKQDIDICELDIDKYIEFPLCSLKFNESKKQPVQEAASGFKLTEAFEMMRKSGKNLAGIMVEISENLGNVATVAEAIDELGNETDKKTARSFLNTVFPAALNFEYSQDSSKQWSDENAQRLEAIFAVASSLLQ